MQPSEVDSLDMADLLQSLVDKSLILFDARTGRFRMLESLREYGRKQMDGLPEDELVRLRHLRCFQDLVADPDIHADHDSLYYEIHGPPHAILFYFGRDHAHFESTYRQVCGSFKILR